MILTISILFEITLAIIVGIAIFRINFVLDVKFYSVYKKLSDI
jgi:hypothetical protein